MRAAGRGGETPDTIAGGVLQVGYQYHGLYKNTPGDKSKRTTTYMIMGGTRFLYAAAVRVFILKVSRRPLSSPASLPESPRQPQQLGRQANHGQFCYGLVAGVAPWPHVP